MLLGWKHIVAASLTGVLCMGALHGMAAEQAGPSKTERSRHQKFLGLRVEAIRPGAVKNLPENFSAGQGLLVVAVFPGSSAEKAGIKPRDILMSFDDQKLFSPRQLAGLVHGEKTGRTIDLTVLRDNKPEQIKVMLSEQEPKPGEPTAQNQKNMPGMMPQAGTTPGVKPNGKEAIEETFDSMTLQSIGKDRFKVQVQYLDKNGKMEKHAFEGNLAELHKSIQSEKDLPSSERAQLLRSLDLLPETIAPEISRRVAPPAESNGRSEGNR